jgi:hypothetical protein
MPNRIYNGHSPEVELNLPDGVVLVKHGESVDVPDEVVKNLDEQGIWLKPETPSASSKSKTTEETA